MKSNLRFRLIATLCVLLMSAVASAFERTWDDYVEAGRQAFQKRQYAEAEKELKFALQATEKFEALDLRRAITLDRLALVYRHQRKNVKAEESYKGALAIYEKALGPERPEVATTQNWGDLNGSRQHFAMKGKGEVDAKKTKEEAARIHSGGSGGSVESLAARGVIETDRPCAG